eukprot:10116453-Alexandrium_andersonii.AAC.1
MPPRAARRLESGSAAFSLGEEAGLSRRGGGASDEEVEVYEDACVVNSGAPNWARPGGRGQGGT